MNRSGLPAECEGGVAHEDATEYGGRSLSLLWDL
jgi:hypothetical protein